MNEIIAERDELRLRVKRLTCSRTWARKSRNMWRERARAAEEMLARKRRYERRKAA